MDEDLLAAQLTDNDPEVRCEACKSVLFIRTERSVDLVLPLLNDPTTVVRWFTCGALHDFGDERAIDPLVERMKDDSDPQVRGTAAYARIRWFDDTLRPRMTEARTRERPLPLSAYMT